MLKEISTNKLNHNKNDCPNYETVINFIGILSVGIRCMNNVRILYEQPTFSNI